MDRYASQPARSSRLAGRAGECRPHRRARRIARSTAFTKPAARVLTREPRGLDRLVDDGVGRDAIEMAELIGAGAQDRAHDRMQRLERARARLGENRVECLPPAEDAGGDLEQQRAVAAIGEVGPRPLEFVGERRLAALDRDQHATAAARAPTCPP